MTVEQIPADKLMTMTEEWHRAFNASGCNPMCHGCYKNIKVNEKFKLATIEAAVAKGSAARNTIESKEVMLCEKCNPEDVEKQDAKVIEEYRKMREEGGGCYRINGKIIH